MSAALALSGESVPRRSRARMRHFGWWPLLALLLIVTTLPSFSLMMLGASSLGMGLALGSVITVAVFAWHRRHATIGSRAVARLLTFGLCVWALLLAHGVVASSITGFFDWGRALSSLVLVTLVLAAAFALARLVEAARPGDVVRAVRVAFVVFAAEGVLALMGVPSLGPALHFMPIIVFMEPSHYSLAFMPFVAFLIIAETGHRRWATVAAVLVLGLLIQSLTLLVGLVLLVALMLPVRRTLLALALVAPSFLVIDTSYFLRRLSFGDDVQNLSALAFLQGWERAILNFQDTHGIGVGFQQFGLVGDLGYFQERIAALFSIDELNLFDGGSNGSKLIGEFGMFGVAALILYLGLMLHAAWACRRIAPDDPGRVHKQFFAACIVAAFTEFFIRGAGYMTPGMMLLATGLLGSFPKQVLPALRIRFRRIRARIA